MSGGILLPGTATTADVNSGKTFSSGAGLNITGTATLAPLGCCCTPTGIDVNSGQLGNGPGGTGGFLYLQSPQTTATATGVKVPVSGAPIIIACALASATMSSISDTFSTGYSWSKVVGLNGSFVDYEIWKGTGGAGTSGNITLTLSGTNSFLSAYIVPTLGCSGVTDTTNTNSGTTSGTYQQVSVGITPGTANELVIGLLGGTISGGGVRGASGAPWTGTPFTSQASNEPSALQMFIYQQAPASALTASVYMNATGVPWQGVIAAFNHS